MIRSIAIDLESKIEFVLDKLCLGNVESIFDFSIPHRSSKKNLLITKNT